MDMAANTKVQTPPTLLEPVMRWTLSKMFCGVEYRQDRIAGPAGPVCKRAEPIFATAVPFSEALLAWAPQENDTVAS